MANPVLSDLDFLSVARITNLPDPAAAQQPATKAYVDSAVEGLAWKDSARVRVNSNINLTSPGATIDGITMATGDRFLASGQTAGSENGLYVWNGAATPATRAADANTFPELEQAVVTIEEGTSAGSTFRQTAVNGTLGTTTVTWVSFGTSAAAADTTTAGISREATQAEVDAGSLAGIFVSPAKLAAWVNRMRQFSANIGDGAATQIDVSHNFATRDLEVQVWETAGSFRRVDQGLEIRLPDTNTVRMVFAAAPASGAYRVVVQAKG